MTRVYRDNYSRRYTGQQPGTKSGRGPAEKPVVNRWLCSSIGLHRISIDPASENIIRDSVFDDLEGKRDGSVVSWANRPVGVPSYPAPPRPAALPCAASSDPPVVCPGFGFDKHQWTILIMLSD